MFRLGGCCEASQWAPPRTRSSVDPAARSVSTSTTVPKRSERVHQFTTGRRITVDVPWRDDRPKSCLCHHSPGMEELRPGRHYMDHTGSLRSHCFQRETGGDCASLPHRWQSHRSRSSSRTTTSLHIRRGCQSKPGDPANNTHWSTFGNLRPTHPKPGESHCVES